MHYIKIKLLSDMCAGNGSSSGNSIDTDISIDNVGLPYIPARRIKGCLRQSAVDLMNMGYSQATEENINKLFGTAYGESGLININNAYMSGHLAMKSFLTEKNKPLPSIIAKEATPDNIVKVFTSVRGQTRLDEGIKVDGTLRMTRVLNQYNPLNFDNDEPLEFVATVSLDNMDEELYKFLYKCCQATRHMGTNRNRGLGNVQMTIEERNDCKVWSNYNHEINTGKVCIEYNVVLESPLTLPGCGETNTMIPARSVIGCMVTNYLKNGTAEDSIFRDLFLNGKTRWSNLTPVICGEVSVPAPLFIMKLKNGGGKLINQLSRTDSEWKRLKPKTIDGDYVSVVECKKDDKIEKEYHTASVNIQSEYHNSISGSQLYMQDYIEPGLVFGGKVIVNAENADKVYDLLTKSKLSFGRSKAAQYASCRLAFQPKVTEYQNDNININKGEVFAVVLKSDLILDDGCYLISHDDIRKQIAKELKVSVDQPTGYDDHYMQHTISGFQNMWHMQKPHIQAICAGSIFFFTAVENSIKNNIYIGEYSQEGFGECYIDSIEDIKKITNVVEDNVCTLNELEKILQINNSISDSDMMDVKKLKSLLIVYVATEAMKRFARSIEVDKDVPIGRLRLMLNDSQSLDDLKNRINTIKTSDESSEKEKGRKKRSIELIDTVYGNTIFEKVSQSEEDVFKVLNTDAVAKTVIEKQWKEILNIVLHNAHYKKGGN